MRMSVRAMLLIGIQCLTASAFGDELSGGTDALRKMARAYEHGDGIAKNPMEAIRMYCQAARSGDAEAMYRLGWMYAIGRGVGRDDPLAAYFFGNAAELGHLQSRNLLPRMGSKVAETPKCMRGESDSEDEPDDAGFTSDSQRHFAELIRRLAPEYGIAPRLALALARTESNLNPRSVSPKNAQGLMQLIPETAERFNVRKPFDPEQNVRGGLAYLRWLLAYFRGDVKLVVAAYNAGEGAVNRYLGVPPYPETRAYVSRILSAYKQGQHPFDSMVADPSPELPRILRRTERVGS